MRIHVIMPSEQVARTMFVHTDAASDDLHGTAPPSPGPPCPGLPDTNSREEKRPGEAPTASPTLTIFREFLWKLHIAWTLLGRRLYRTRVMPARLHISITGYTGDGTRFPGGRFAFTGGSCVKVMNPGCTSFLEDYDSHESQGHLLANRFIYQLMSPGGQMLPRYRLLLLLQLD